MPQTTEKMKMHKDGGVGWMIFNNPERRNALGLEMQQAIPQILGEFAADDKIRVVVMTGAGGKAFVSGADISEFEQRRSSPEAIAEYDQIAADANRAYTTLGKPLIAMIRGYCLGGGLALAMYAEMRIASENSQFGIPAAKLGIAPGFEMLKALVDLIGPARANEVMLTGRRMDADEALRIGLVNRVVPAETLEAAVREIAEAIRNNAPLSVEASKFTIREVLKEPDVRDLAEIDRLTKACFDSQDYKEGREAFMEKRKPVFKGQ